METAVGQVGLELELDRELARAQLTEQLFGLPRPAVRLGRFELARRLGHGAMGTVYEAWDPARGARVALKLLSQTDARGVYRLKREFRSLAATSHPNLVALDELFCEQDRWFFSMELIEAGEPFADWVRPDRRCERERLRAAFAQLCSAVQAIHAAGKLHCDLKPRNVLVTPAGRVVVLDFGLVSDCSGSSAQSRHTGIVGTPAYLAPEQADGQTPSEASDWYAVGVMLFEALCGELPFDGSPFEVLAAKRKQPAPKLPEHDGAEPAADALEALCGALLDRDPHARPSGEEVIVRARSAAADTTLLAPEPSASTSPGTSDAGAAGAIPLFVGREDELAVLRAALERASRGSAVTLLVGGRSGIGKSALLERFVSELGPDVLVLRGRCHEQESVPYKVFDSVMDALASHLRRSGEAQVLPIVPRHAASLLRLFPGLGRIEALAPLAAPSRAPSATSALGSSGASAISALAGSAPSASAALSPPIDVRELRNQAFAALKELLLRITDRTRVIVVVDDLQWGDVDSARMMEHVFALPEPPPLLFLGAFRSDDHQGSPFLRELLEPAPGTGAAPQVLELGTLPPSAALTLARALLAGDGSAEPPNDEVAVGVAAEAEGLPFFIGELVQQYKAGAPRLRAAGERAQPVTLERAILDRVAALPESAQTLLQVLCVAGGPLEQGIALDAAEASDPHAAERNHGQGRAALALLRAARLLRTRGGNPSDAAEIYHDRVRESVTRQLAPALTRRLHACIASAMERHGVVDPERIVKHHAGAGDHARATDLASRAATAAVSKLAFNRAAELLRMAIEHSSEAAQRGALYLRLADALVNAGRGGLAAQAFLRAAEQAHGAEARRLKRLAAQHYLRSGHTEEGLHVAHGLFADLGLSLPKDGILAAGSLLWQRARLATRRLALNAPRKPPSAEQLERLECLGAVFPELSVTDMIGGAVLQAQHLREALDAGEPQHALQGLVWEAFNLTALGGEPNMRRVREALRLARAIAGELDTLHARSMVALGEAAYHCFSGRAFRPALLPSALAESGFAEIGSAAAWERGVAGFVHCVSLEFTGPFTELWDRGLELMREAQERDDRFTSMLMLLSVPYALLARGQPEEALRLLRDHEDHVGPGYTTFRHVWLIRMVDALLGLNRPVEALQVLDAQWQGFLRSSHHRCPFIRDGVYFYRARAAIMAYEERRDPADRRLGLHDCNVLARSPTAYRWCGEALREGLLWDGNERERWLARLDAILPRMLEAGGEVFHLYLGLTLARLKGEHESRAALGRAVGALGVVREVERWAWYTVPVGPPPQNAP